MHKYKLFCYGWNFERQVLILFYLQSPNFIVHSASADCLVCDLWINIQKSTRPDKIHTHIPNIPILFSNFRGRWSYKSMRCGKTVTACVIIFIRQIWKHAYLLTPWSRVILEKLTGLQLVNKFPAFHGTRRFITALTSVRHLSLSCGPAQSSPYTHIPPPGDPS